MIGGRTSEITMTMTGAAPFLLLPMSFPILQLLPRTIPLSSPGTPLITSRQVSRFLECISPTIDFRTTTGCLGTDYRVVILVRSSMVDHRRINRSEDHGESDRLRVKERVSGQCRSLTLKRCPSSYSRMFKKCTVIRIWSVLYVYVPRRLDHTVIWHVTRETVREYLWMTSRGYPSCLYFRRV